MAARLEDGVPRLAPAPQTAGIDPQRDAPGRSRRFTLRPLA
jgi:hypothetical protein